MKKAGVVIWLFVLISGATLGLQACQSRQDPAPKTEEESLSLIQTKQYDEAIAKLTKALRDHPSDKLRQLAASAYAAKAGIFVEDYWGFLAGFKTPLVGTQDLSQNSDYVKVKSILQRLNPTHFSENAKAFDLIFQNLAKVQVYAERLDSIPSIDESQASLLEKGLAILEPVESAGAKLYDSLLWLIIIRKSILEGASAWSASVELLQKVDLNHLESETNRQLICSIDQVGFVAWIRNLAKAISRVSTDLSVAYPSQSEQISQAQVWLSPLVKFSVSNGFCK